MRLTFGHNTEPVVTKNEPVVSENEHVVSNNEPAVSKNEPNVQGWRSPRVHLCRCGAAACGA